MRFCLVFVARLLVYLTLYLSLCSVVRSVEALCVACGLCFFGFLAYFLPREEKGVGRATGGRVCVCMWVCCVGGLGVGECVFLALTLWRFSINVDPSLCSFCTTLLPVGYRYSRMQNPESSINGMHDMVLVQLFGFPQSNLSFLIGPPKKVKYI